MPHKPPFGVLEGMARRWISAEALVTLHSIADTLTLPQEYFPPFPEDKKLVRQGSGRTRCGASGDGFRPVLEYPRKSVRQHPSQICVCPLLHSIHLS